jgi:MerR family transcriptional regulator, light-induced transcriptional regulator
MSQNDGYSIGAASRLSGVSREKIRIWERRYGAVNPRRDGANRRLYSREDVERLRLIDRLASLGHALPAIANLSLADLQRHAAEATETSPAPGTAAPERVLLVCTDSGGATPLIAAGLTGITRVADFAAAAAWLAEHGADLIIVDQPTLLGQDVRDSVRLQRRAPAVPMLVVYRFAPSSALAQLRSAGVRARKAPLEPHDLLVAETARSAHEIPTAEPDHAPPRRYGPDALQRLATLAPAVACECPRHLANLVSDLQAFEDYSLDCENESPDDAPLHREIHRVVARARALVEDALDMVTAEEGLAEAAADTAAGASTR